VRIVLGNEQYGIIYLDKKGLGRYEIMSGKEYECGDCGRAFQVYQGEQKKPKCPSCEGENVSPKQSQPLPSWLLSKNLEVSS
jgi:hypothetical protein